MRTWDVGGYVYDQSGNLPQVKTAFLSEVDAETILVAGVVSKKIRVLAATFFASATLTFQTAFDPGTAITPDFSQSATLPYNPHGWFETAAGADLSILPDSSCAVHVLYVEVA